MNPVQEFSIFHRNKAGGNSGLPRNSPGTVREEPYTASETESPVSSLGTVRRPKRTKGRWRNQSEPANRERRADLRERWNLSIMPLLWGWNAVVVDVEIPREEQTPAQTEEVNCAPLSEVRTAGTPNLETQVDRKAQAQVSAEIELNGATSGH